MPRTMCALLLCCLALTGCLPDAQKQLQIAEENARDRDLDVRTIGDVVDIGEPSTVPIQVDGVGLVTGLAGTGNSPSGYHRTLLEQYLLKHNTLPGGQMHHLANDVKVRQILDNPDNALVIVKGFIPAGAHKGDRFDVEIALPANSKTSSLAGGYLELSILRVYEAAANLSNRPEVAGKLLEGDIFAHAKGRLFVGFGNNTDPHELKHARIWQGGVSRIDRAYAFCMRDDKKSLGIASEVAKRINFMYQDDPNSPARRFEFTKQEKLLLTMGNAANQLNMRQDPFGATGNDVAKATKECVIQVRVPAAYRFDHQRFERVALFTPLRDTDVNLKYRQRLQKLVLDPSDCKWALWAALHLEALGRDSIPALKAGLTNEHPFIRFICAESLAYLGSTAGVDTLAELARSQPVLAKNCTIALANLSETIARDRLGELLADEEPALRCAAFHALTLLDETDQRLGGKFLGDSFWLYRVPQASTPMVYFSTSKRAQVVLFGKDVILQPETRMMVGTRREFTVAHSKEQNRFVIKRFTPRGEAERVVSNRLGEVLDALAELGATYPDVIDFLRQAQVYQAVNCPIVHWSIPEVTVDTLVDAGKGMK